MVDLVLRSDRIVVAGQVRPGAILVRNGQIVDVQARDESVETRDEHDLGSHVIMAGLVDSHVHVNEPGRADWEGWRTASRAAAAGGITTIFDMPLNSDPVTTTVDAVQAKADVAHAESLIDFGLWGGLVPGNEHDVVRLIDAGALGIKCFLAPSGLDAFQPVNADHLRIAATHLAFRSVPLLVHAESAEVIASHAREGPLHTYAEYLATRPKQAEVDAIGMVCEIARETGCHCHIVHVSCTECIDVLLDARSDLVSWETCPHYLTFAAEDIPDGATLYKCAPPIRRRQDRHKLWNAIEVGDLDFIVTDHSPCPPSMKHLDDGDFNAAWGGIASLQFSLPAVWTAACSRGFTEADVARWMCERPARLAGLNHRKGWIKRGHDADFVVWNPDETRTVTAESIYHRHPISPYVGHAMRGVVQQTWVRGRLVFDDGRFDDSLRGEWLRRGSHA